MQRLSLLAAGAIIAISGGAFAMDGGGVSISGSANFGVKFAESDDDSKSELQFHHEFDVTFAASGTTDGGIGFGGKVTIDNTESVSGRTAVAAKTGYIVTADDVDEDGRKALLNARFGFDTSTLKEGDVIVSGSTANLSGYEKATDVKGHDRVITPAVDPITSTTTWTYTANAAGPVKDDLNTLAVNEATDGGIFGALGAEVISPSENETYTVKVGENTWNVTEVKLVQGSNNGNATGLDAQDKILITQADGTVIQLNYADNVGDTSNAGWWRTGKDADGTTDLTAENAAYILATENIVVTRVKTTPGAPAVLISGEEKVKLSQAYIDSLSGSITEADSQSVNNHGEVYISMDMHKLTIGSDLDAADKLAGGLKDPGFDGLGIDDVAEGPYGESAKQVRYDGDFGVASVAISYGDNAGDAAWAAGFSFDVEPVTFGAGFDSNGVMSVGMGFTQGAIAMNALYSTDSDHDEADNEGFACGADADVTNKDKAAYSAAKSAACTLNSDKNIANKPDLKNQAFGVDVRYQMSEATSVVLVAAQHKKESAHLSYKAGDSNATPATNNSLTWSTTSTTVDAFGVGFSHDLGGGATLSAGAGSVDSNAVADLGISMKF